ncbi:MAG: hypothetical protein ABUT20_00310 [Bacteroidota bacterium]
MKALQHAWHPAQLNHHSKKSIVKSFFSWCGSQEQYRIGWLAVIIASHGCIITPLTLISIILSGNYLLYWVMAMSAMGMALVTNLAALPAKITIPVFFLSIAIDLYIVINCLVAGFNIAATYQ